MNIDPEKGGLFRLRWNDHGIPREGVFTYEGRTNLNGRWLPTWSVLEGQPFVKAGVIGEYTMEKVK